LSKERGGVIAEREQQIVKNTKYPLAAVLKVWFHLEYFDQSIRSFFRCGENSALVPKLKLEILGLGTEI